MPKLDTPVAAIVDDTIAWLHTVHNMTALARHSGISLPTLRGFRVHGKGMISTLERLIVARREGPPPPFVTW